MADFRQRELSPVQDGTWQAVDDTVERVARGQLVGRRVINIFGPLGPGVQTLATDVFTGTGVGSVDFLGEAPAEAVRAERREHVALPILYKDFSLHWRDLETQEQFGVPLDVSPFAAAAAFCAQAEDNLIFNGHPELGYEGLRNATGRTSLPMGDWYTMGKAFDDVIAATQALVDAGFYGPYALVVSPRLFASMHRVYANTGVLEIEQVRKITTHGVYQSAVLPEPSALVLAAGAQNLELAVAQDMTTAFLETRNLNHYFRVMEIVALHIHRPGAVAAIEPAVTHRPGEEAHTPAAAPSPPPGGPAPQARPPQPPPGGPAPPPRPFS